MSAWNQLTLLSNRLQTLWLRILFMYCYYEGTQVPDITASANVMSPKQDKRKGIHIQRFLNFNFCVNKKKNETVRVKSVKKCTT